MVFDKPTGRPDQVQLSRARIGSIIRELEAILARPDFFGSTPPGINCASGFVRFTADGGAELVAHDPAHRQRFTLAARWDKWLAEAAEPPEGSLLYRLLDGCFGDDPDRQAKFDLVGELLGCAATGYSTRLREPKAFIFIRTARRERQEPDARPVVVDTAGGGGGDGITGQVLRREVYHRPAQQAVQSPRRDLLGESDFLGLVQKRRQRRAVRWSRCLQIDSAVSPGCST
jgi:hypothetical protein